MNSKPIIGGIYSTNIDNRFNIILKDKGLMIIVATIEFENGIITALPLFRDNEFAKDIIDAYDFCFGYVRNLPILFEDGYCGRVSDNLLGYLQDSCMFR